MNNENSYIQIDIDYTNFNFPGVSRFTTVVKDVEHIHDALMEAIRYVEKVGAYKTHSIIAHVKRDEELGSYEEGASDDR